jgi:lysophospholipase L1-like esterase
MHCIRAAALAVPLALALAGCGGGGDRQVVAALGDSITAGAPGYGPDAAQRRRYDLGTNPESQYEYWAQKEHPELQVRNCGVFGERTYEIVRRLQDCSLGADGIVIQGGINDLVQGFPVDVVAANLRGMVRAAKGMNLDVALAEILPVNEAPTRGDALIGELNRRIHDIGGSEGVDVLPFYETLEDPGSPGRMKAEWTADGLHPSVQGYRRLGEIAFSPPGD